MRPTPPTAPAPRGRLRLALLPLLLGALAFAAGAAGAGDGWRGMGHRPEGARLERIQRSPRWVDGAFVNPQKVQSDLWGSVFGALDASPDTLPSGPLPVDGRLAERLRLPPATGLRVSWLGHSSILIEIDGLRVLTDPVWSERVSPVQWAGPKRWYAPPVSLDELGALDAVLISHDHYDHLDHLTILALRDRGARFLVPLGVGAHLAYWGVPEDRITELDWWEEAQIGGLTLTCTPARHASGRLNPQSNKTLWAGWALRGPSHRVYFSGDTGLFPGMADIGEKLGPFDLTLIEAGAYNQAWPDWHLGPEQTVKAHELVKGELLLPVHWGLFNLAMHAWTEPAERVIAAAERSGQRVIVPRPGQSVEPDAPPPLVRWWPRLSTKTAEEDPIWASGMDSTAR